jgi:hypothetical protein
VIVSPPNPWRARATVGPAESRGPRSGQSRGPRSGHIIVIGNLFTSVGRDRANLNERGPRSGHTVFIDTCMVLSSGVLSEDHGPGHQHVVAARWQPASLSSPTTEDRGHGHQNAIVVAGRRHEEFSATLSSEVHGHGHQNAIVVAGRWHSSLPSHGTPSCIISESLTRGPRSGHGIALAPVTEMEEKDTEGSFLPFFGPHPKNA